MKLRIPKDHIIGSTGDGWAAALTTLAFERWIRKLTKNHSEYKETKSKVLDQGGSS